MARTNPAAETWGAWLRPLLAELDVSQAEFGKRVVAAGGTAKKQTVSQWYNGANAADPNNAVIVADVLGASRADALRAAGYGIVADAVNDGPQARKGEAPDEAIRILLARKDRTPEQLADAVLMYNKRKDRLVAEMLRILDAMDEPNGQTRTA
jgi:hypothetical protein